MRKINNFFYHSVYFIILVCLVKVSLLKCGMQCLHAMMFLEQNFLLTNFNLFSKYQKFPSQTSYTVEPRLYGHQGDMRNCLYYRGVRNKRVIFLKKCMSLLFVGANKTVRNIGVSVLSGCP